MVDMSASGQVLHGRALPGPAARLPGGVGPHRRVGRHARGPQQGEATLVMFQMSQMFFVLSPTSILCELTWLKQARNLSNVIQRSVDLPAADVPHGLVREHLRAGRVLRQAAPHVLRPHQVRLPHRAGRLPHPAGLRQCPRHSYTIYTLSTQNLHNIYIISTQYLYILYILSTLSSGEEWRHSEPSDYLHNIYRISTQYLHNIYIISIHTIYTVLWGGVATL